MNKIIHQSQIIIHQFRNLIFKNRVDAGQKLALKLTQYKSSKDAIILALPRGGVAVAKEVSRVLNLPMDLIVSRKIGAPENPEFAIGAIAEGFKGIFDQKNIEIFNVSEEYIKNEVEKEKKEIDRRLGVYRARRAPLNLEGKTAILVDDGIATGLTMIATINAAKIKGAEKVVVAAPVVSRDSAEKIKKLVDDIIYLDAPEFFAAVGQFYEAFNQIEDEEIIKLMTNE